jgi:hypothetical protein
LTIDGDYGREIARALIIGKLKNKEQLCSIFTNIKKIPISKVKNYRMLSKNKSGD